MRVYLAASIASSSRDAIDYVHAECASARVTRMFEYTLCGDSPPVEREAPFPGGRDARDLDVQTLVIGS